MQVTTVGLDLAKRVFQVHGVDAVGRVAVRRKRQRAQVASSYFLPPCLVGIEACTTATLIAQADHQCYGQLPGSVRPERALLGDAVIGGESPNTGRPYPVMEISQ